MNYTVRSFTKIYISAISVTVPSQEATAVDIVVLLTGKR